MAHTSVVALTQDLVRVDTVNPPGNEAGAVRIIAPILHGAGFTVKEHGYGLNRQSLVAHFGGSDRPSILLSGHLDTVPFGAQPWKNPPLAGELVGNRLYGRGSADMKGGVAVLVTAAVEFSARVTDTPITVVLSADEEIGCSGAAQLITDGAIPPASCVLVAEPTGNIPCLGHKGILWLKITMHGKTAHAAFPELGDNALVKAARAVVALNGDIFAGNAHPVMGEASLVTSRLFSGDNYNSVPDLAEIGIDIRSTVNWSHAVMLNDIEKLLAVQQAEVEVLYDLPPLWTNPDNELVREIFESCDAVRGKKHLPRIVTFYTDGGLLGPGLGDIPVVVLGPGESGMAHQVDEYVRVEDLHQSVDIYLEILSRLCR
ncbi:MAG: M20 family metallopeptidase [Desulforhopalus sp.]